MFFHIFSCWPSPGWDTFRRHCFESSWRLQPNEGTSKELIRSYPKTTQASACCCCCCCCWCWTVCCNSPSNKQWWQRHMIKQVCGLPRAKTPHLQFKCSLPSCSPKQFETGETWHVASGQAGIGKAMAGLHENEINASCPPNEYL